MAEVSILGGSQTVGAENTGGPSDKGNLVQVSNSVSMDNKEGILQAAIDPADGSLIPQANGSSEAL